MPAEEDDEISDLNEEEQGEEEEEAPQASGRRAPSASDGSGERRPRGSSSAARPAARDDRGGQERIEEVPDWDGDLRLWRNYKRRVRVWLEGTLTKAEKQGARLLSRLTGDAWQCTEDVDMTLLRSQGAKYLLRYLEESLEVEEFHLVGRAMEDFFFSTRREHGEHINKYINKHRISYSNEGCWCCAP